MQPCTQRLCWLVLFIKKRAAVNATHIGQNPSLVTAVAFLSAAARARRQAPQF
jgi:hypothetical protein